VQLPKQRAHTEPPRPQAAVPVSTSHPEANRFELRGTLWHVHFEGRSGVIQDCRGLRYIAFLLRDASSGQRPLHAKELAALATGHAPDAIELDLNDSVLDSTAKQALLTRLEAIASERDRACAVEDFARATALDDEYERIAGELNAARGGKHKRGGASFAHAGEKARKAVGKAITEAIARIASHPDLSPLADHLTSSIRKGQWLSYHATSGWQVDVRIPPPAK
jgi:hypothetical protein